MAKMVHKDYPSSLPVNSYDQQSLEFVAETRILVEMNIENRNQKKIVPWGKKSTCTFLFYEN